MKNIMKFVLSLAAVVILSTSASAVLVKLPSAEILKQRITKVASKHFAEKAKLHTALGGQEKEAVVIALMVELAYAEYLEYFEDNTKKSKIATLVNKSSILLTILDGEDAAIRELAQAGLLN
jgi:hypothetical protein